MNFKCIQIFATRKEKELLSQHGEHTQLGHIFIRDGSVEMSQGGIDFYHRVANILQCDLWNWLHDKMDAAGYEGEKPTNFRCCSLSAHRIRKMNKHWVKVPKDGRYYQT